MQKSLTKSQASFLWIKKEAFENIMAMLYSQESLIFDLIINMNKQIGGLNMKCTYALSNEENTIEIDKKWVDILNNLIKPSGAMIVQNSDGKFIWMLIISIVHGWRRQIR